MVHYLTSHDGGNSSVVDAVTNAFDKVVTKDFKGGDLDFPLVHARVVNMLVGGRLPHVVKVELDKVFQDYQKIKAPVRTLNLPGGDIRDTMLLGQDTRPGGQNDSSSSDEEGFDSRRF